MASPANEGWRENPRSKLLRDHAQGASRAPHAAVGLSDADCRRRFHQRSVEEKADHRRPRPPAGRRDCRRRQEREPRRLRVVLAVAALARTVDRRPRLPLRPASPPGRGPRLAARVAAAGPPLHRPVAGPDPRRLPGLLRGAAERRQVRAPRLRRLLDRLAVDEMGQPAGRLHAARGDRPAARGRRADRDPACRRSGPGGPRGLPGPARPRADRPPLVQERYPGDADGRSGATRGSSCCGVWNAAKAGSACASRSTRRSAARSSTTARPTASTPCSA